MGLFSNVVDTFHRETLRDGNLRGGPGRDMSGMQTVPPSNPALSDLLIAISKGMDLLEGKSMRSAMKITFIAGSIAKMMFLPEREVASVVYASLVHDIGLAPLVPRIFPHLPPGLSEKNIFQTHTALNARVIGFPFDRPVSNEVFDLLHQHPTLAAEFISKIGLSRDVSDLVAAHHELMDGSGYPLGLSGEEIPMGARILAFADVVESVLDAASREVAGLTSRRQILDNFLEVKAPTRFDSRVIETFQTLLNTHDDFLRALASLDVENMARQLIPERSLPLDGTALYRVVTAMGGLSDDLMPQYKQDRSQQVADMAVQLAQSLGIHPEQCGELAIAAILMDIGHLATPAHILFKTTPLSSDERIVVHEHPHFTYEILKNVPGFANVSLWASEHHERMNGKGYPAHRKGFEISVGGRILALADVFDALTSRRPYREHAHEPMDAIPVIGQGRMTLYDNALVTQLRTVVLRREIPVR